MSDNKTVIAAARVVVTKTSFGLRPALEIQLPGTNLWLEARSTFFMNDMNLPVPYIEVAGKSLKRFASSLNVSPVRVDTPAPASTATEELI